MLKNVTITVEEDVAQWARRRAAKKNTSDCKLVGQMLKEEMVRNDDYWRAYEHWKSIPGFPALEGGEYLSREEIHERRR